MTADEILDVKKPEELFVCNPSEIKTKFHELARKWHPDTNKTKKATEVFQHLNILYKDALKRVAEGNWELHGTFTFKEDNGKTRTIEYLTKRDFELGVYYVSDKEVTYLLNKEHKELYTNALSTIKGFKYASAKMEKEVSRYLPSKVTKFKTEDGRFALSIEKTPDLLLLRDVLEYYGGKIDPKHVAWIMSTLHNLCCYLGYSKLTHNAISLDTYFISPEHHSGALLGGWWYSIEHHETLKKVPTRTFGLLPWDVRKDKKASYRTDLDLIRAVGRELCGDLYGRKMVAPKPMKDWFNGVSEGKAIEEYEQWQEVLKESFGPKKFQVMSLDAKSLYKK